MPLLARIRLARRCGRSRDVARRARLVAAAIVAVPLIAYPLVVGADGARFPSSADCVRIASPGETAALDLVFGRRDTAAEAERLLERVQGVGYVDAEVRGDGCGRWKVLYDGITPTLRARARRPRRTVPVSRRGSRSSHPASSDPYDSPS